MANNRLWLVHRPSGETIFLGKRMAVGWYGAPSDLGEKLNLFFEQCSEGDDFVLAIEDASGAPGATDKWTYENHKPRLHENAKAVLKVAEQIRNQTQLSGVMFRGVPIEQISDMDFVVAGTLAENAWRELHPAYCPDNIREIVASNWAAVQIERERRSKIKRPPPFDGG